GDGGDERQFGRGDRVGAEQTPQRWQVNAGQLEEHRAGDGQVEEVQPPAGVRAALAQGDGDAELSDAEAEEDQALPGAAGGLRPGADAEGGGADERAGPGDALPEPAAEDELLG